MHLRVKDALFSLKELQTQFSQRFFSLLLRSECVAHSPVCYPPQHDEFLSSSDDIPPASDFHAGVTKRHCSDRSLFLTATGQQRLYQKSEERVRHIEWWPTLLLRCEDLQHPVDKAVTAAA